MKEPTKECIKKQKEDRLEKNGRIADEIIQTAVQCSPKDVKKYME